MLHSLHQFVPDLYSVTLFLPTSSNTAYRISGIGRFHKILPCPHEDEQEQHFSSASIKFLCDKSTIPPVYLQLLTTLYRPSWATVHNTFFLSTFSLLLYIFFRSSRWETTIVINGSGGKLSHVRSFNTKNCFSEGQKILVNSENKENLSNYQLLKRKPSVCSASLHLSKLITCVQFFFSHNTSSAMVSIKFWCEKFSRPATEYECIAHVHAFDRS